MWLVALHLVLSARPNQGVDIAITVINPSLTLFPIMIYIRLPPAAQLENIIQQSCQSATQLSVESVLASQTKHLKGCSELLSGRKVILFMSRAFILAHWTDDGNKYIAIVSETQFMLEQIVNTLLSSCQSNPAFVKNTLHYTTKTLIIAPGLSAN